MPCIETACQEAKHERNNLREQNARQAHWLGQIRQRLMDKGMHDAYYLVCDVMHESWSPPVSKKGEQA